MTTQPTNEAAIQQWNTMPRKVMEAMEPDGDFAKRHLINPVLPGFIRSASAFRPVVKRI
ncbi:hypothetical protein [Streptomyces sp. TRM68367]|uniref:hypothetical protein n=1 Tax=Streptomyces sp. TRM68367 TaxID=2758415 RepID=UPI00165CC1CF|nr:hypothetical protein [Streptomyces sp. TRM68367]MBC9730190.1 hypothetical protein [Streptomyces sp. TRM68367]